MEPRDPGAALGDRGSAPPDGLHDLLVDQLRLLGLSPDEPPDHAQWRELLERVSTLAAAHARLVAITDHCPIAIVEADDDGRVLFENASTRELTGRSLVELGQALLDSVHEADMEAVRAAALATLHEGGARTVLARFRREEGGVRWCRLLLRPRQTLAGRRWLVAATDVTDEIEARAASDRLTALLEAATDVVAVFDPDGRLLQLNRIGCQLLGIGGEHEIAGRTLDELFETASRERIRTEAVPALRIAGTWHGEAELVGPNGITPVSLVLLAHHDEHGELAYCSAIARDVTELKDVQHALAREATHDALTGLPNRTLLLDRLEHAVLRSQRTGNDIAVLYVDLDRVKLVNDSLGHDAGDALLVEAARRLRRVARDADTVGRLGGDEFVVIAEDIAGPEAGVQLAMRIVYAFDDPFDLGGTEAFVTASVGVAFRSAASDTAATLLRDADVAMYRAKQTGGGRYELFDQVMRRWVTERFELEAALRRAIERDELYVHFQPQLRVDTGEVVGFEALARWKRRGGSLVLPSAFIPLAEETGLISTIGAHVLDVACRQAAAWNQVRQGSPPLAVGVNLSGRQLARPGFEEVVASTLDVTGLDPRLLTLEMTESVLLHDPEIAEARLRSLRGLGVRLALDDFGTGYSSLAYLQRFPIDTVKVDREFVASLPFDATIVASIIRLAHALGFEVVAEGVETQEQLDVLATLDCDVVQGYVWTRPCDADAALRWLTTYERDLRAATGS